MRICENSRCVYPSPAVDTRPPAEVVAPVPPPHPANPPDASSLAAASASAAAPLPPAPAAVAVDVVAAPKEVVPGPSHVAAGDPWAHQPSRPFLVEVSGFGFEIHNGKAAALGAGLQIAYRFSRWLALGARIEGTGEREQAMVRGRAAYRLYDFGLGLSVGETVGPLFADLSLLPELTWLAVEGRDLNPGKSVTRWGAAADVRLRLGLMLGRLCPYVFAAASYAFRAERLTVDDSPYPSTTLPRGNVSLGLGLAYLVGVPGANGAN